MQRSFGAFFTGHSLLMTLILALQGLGGHITVEAQYQFKTDFYDVPLDHFSFTTNRSFALKYLYNDSWWSPGGPIFFYTGNEGSIELFAQNTGFMWDIAKEFDAHLLFVEHRYYGVSLPFGNESYSSPDKLGYLTSEQALADFATFLTFYKNREGFKESPVIAFGGSYGGMLTAWMRMKYPHIVQGGIAASAPILQFQGITPCNVYGKIVTDDFTKESKNCSESIRRSWSVINSFGATEAGRQWLSTHWKLCKPLKSDGDVKDLKNWLVDVYGNLAMVNYPYSSSFLEPLPGHPIKAVCEKITDPALPDKYLLRSIFKGLSVYFNYTGTAKCLDAGAQATPDLGDLGWDYQACTEMVMPMCTDGISDFFEPVDWNMTSYEADCHKKWGVKPRPFMAQTMYGGRDILAASNIVFTNGLLDPWSGGGVLANLTSSLHSIIIPEGAHHLDLRGGNPNDPPSVIFAREFEKTQIRQWIQEHQDSLNYQNH